ncbi:uncharacterized protein M6B38_136570 [Iris pallida]|uniref:Uncharacterized protein n=1 Tax=Iris pallida TaxID=29817 RepID=A0AAX6FEY3_IRIPA|nr:uncharacterized protein M6B38_136570 [Iris pallida]
MGTKVQLKSYLPEVCAMRDLNEDADSSWSQYHGDRASGRLHFGHSQQTGRSNRYLGSDRESMKQTMLAQNATFRNQVYELHRLYNRQKELMDELKKKGPYGYLQADTSLSNSYSSQIPSDGTNKMRHVPHLASTSTSYNKVPVTMNGDKVPPLNFLKESCTQSGLVLTGKGAAPEDGGIMDSTSNRHPRRTFDLQLPAEVYIDCEDAEKPEKEIVADSSSVNMFPLNSIRAAPKKDVKLALGTSESFYYRENSLKSDLCTQNGVAHGLADLNEPVKENLFERAAGSVSYNLLGQRTTREENQGHQLLTRSNTSFPGVQSSFFRGRHTEEGTYPNLLHADKKEISQEWPFFNNEAGQTTSIRTLFGPGPSKENFSISSEATQLKFKKPREILSPNQNQKDMWYKNKQAHGIEISGGYPPCEQSAPLMPNSFSALPNRDYTSTVSPLLSSWTKPSNDYSGVLAGQSLPCFGGAVAQNESCTSHKWQRNGDLRSHPILGAQPSSHQNGFTNVSFQQHYNSASQLYLQPITFGKPNLDSRVDNDNESRRSQVTSKDVNSSQVDLNGIQICRTAQSKPVISDSKGKHDSSSGIPSWLRSKPNGISSHIELDFSNGYPKLKPSCSTVYPGPEEETPEMEKSRYLLNLQDLPSASQLQESGVAKTESSDGLSSKKIFGFTIIDETKQNPALSAPHQQPPPVTSSSTKCSDKDQIPPGGPVTEISCTGFRSRINLNSDPDEEEAVVVPPLVPSSTVVSEINLEAEAPATSEAEEADAALVKEAAESILWMLSKERSRLENLPCHPQPHASSDTLNWFAELVSSNGNSVKGSSGDGLDLFEQMTLELEETKPEEFWCSRPGKGEGQKDDDDRKDIAATLLFPKPRRGQGRRRRQRRDFQTDILPGLASLSRLEVTEDIQTISGLMKASGQPWQSGSARRNTGRSRGRRPRSLAVAVAEIPASPPPPPPPPPVSAEAQPSNRTEIEADGGNIVGWGRTTRRCRRQRCPPVTNIAAPVSLRHLL